MGVKGVIVAAGYGTRFLPVTRCLPKEMLPLVDRPAIDFILQEMTEAGIEELLVITSRRKKVLEDWFDRDPELEAVFEREGAQEKLRKIKPPQVHVVFVRQPEMKGTGHALSLARNFAGSDPVVVAYPDVLFAAPNCSAELIKAWQSSGCSVLSCSDCSGWDLSRYGVLDVQERDGHLRVRSIVEKPERGTEPSALVSWGRYLYTPAFFELVEEGLKSHVDGEYDHTHALNVLAARGQVVAVQSQGERFDTGSPLGYVKAFVRHALEREDMGEELRAWLTEFMQR